MLKKKHGTWLGRHADYAEVKLPRGERWNLHRWADTGETSLIRSKGDGRRLEEMLGAFQMFEEHFTTTESWDDAAAWAEVIIDA